MFRFLRTAALFLAALAVSATVYGTQGSQRVSTAIANVGSYAKVLANAQIMVCSYTVGVDACSSPVIVYQDPALTIPYPSTTFRADGNGNYSYWAAAGNYVEQVCATGAACTVQVITLGSAGGGSPSAPANSIQIANSGLNGFASDTNFQINPTTHTFTSTGNMLINALSITPRAIYDPMDTKYCASGGTICGLQAAIAIQNTNITAPTQVIQAAMDAGECAIQTGVTVFDAIEIPLPSGVQINIGGLKFWDTTSFGGDSSLTGPLLQHNDATQPMLSGHSAGDTITCNGTSYNPVPGGVAGVYIHDIRISGAGPANTDTDIGIELNMESSAAVNIIGQNQGFGAAAVLSNGTSTFLQNIGYPGGQIKGCMTYNGGIRPVSGFSLGGGICGSIMDASLDGGMSNVYATDGQAFASGHAAGPCYPHCAAVAIGGSGTYDDTIFAQVSGVGVIVDGIVNKINTVRVDFTSREAVQFSGTSGGGNIFGLVVDAACTDIALEPAYAAGTPTGCYVSNWLAGGGYGITQMSVADNSGILAPAYVQCWVNDGETGGVGSGQPSVWDIRGYIGSPQNTTSNDWAFCGQFDGSFVSGRVIFPDMPFLSATGSTSNASGITAIALNGQTLSTITAGIAGQHLLVKGPGVLQPGTGTGTNNIRNLDGLSDTITQFQTVEYVEVQGLVNNIWQMIAGPANQTPTHVNYLGNTTPTNPALLSVIGDSQTVVLGAVGLDVSQIHGTTSGSGQACFEQQLLLADGHYVVSPLECTTVNLAAQTAGEIFASTAPQATPVLYLVTNTEGNGVATGKYPAPCAVGTGACPFWDGPTTIAAGGDGSTPPTASANNTGVALIGFGIQGPATAPSGTCTADYGGVTVISQDGHATYCPTSGGTWTTKY